MRKILSLGLKQKILTIIGFIAVSLVTTALSYPKEEFEPFRIQHEPIAKQVWAYYTGSYGNPVIDGHYIHWRMRINKYYGDYFEPPSNIPSHLYPELGLYSSHDKSVLQQHIVQMMNSGIDAAIIHWWGTNSSEEIDVDADGFTDTTTALLLEVASELNFKIAVQIQPYPNRNSTSTRKDIDYILEKYSNQNSYLKINGLPAIFVYEPHEVKGLGSEITNITDKVFLLATFANHNNVAIDHEMGFRSAVSFFASDGFTWSSSSGNWKNVKKSCNERGMSFVAAVGPGYNIEKIDSWSRDTKRSREGGKYYEKMWKNAIDAEADSVIINSFNGWVDATEIEPAYQLENYKFNKETWTGENGKPEDFLELTRKFVTEYLAK